MENVDPSKERAPAAPEQMQQGTPIEAELNTMRDALKSAKDEQLRLLAEMDNQRKRMQRDVEAARRYGAERVLTGLLPVVDSLERGLAEGASDPSKLRAGMDLTLRQLHKALADQGLETLDPVGQAFDPEQHQAMSVTETGQFDPGTVAGVMQKGYRLQDRLLRPALVVVAQEPPPPEDA
jgi:molecular chaperone GrpE